MSGDWKDFKWKDVKLYKVAGLDPSLSATGLALNNVYIFTPESSSQNVSVSTIKTTPSKTLEKPKAGKRRPEDLPDTFDRINSIVSEVLAELETWQPMLVVIERNLQSVHATNGLNWLHGVLRRELLACGYKILEVYPTSLKKFALPDSSERGKEQVLAAAIKAFDDAGITNNNESDAAWLSEIGSALYGVSKQPLSDGRLEVLAAIYEALPMKDRADFVRYAAPPKAKKTRKKG
jgi:Holliday junction resolvasome RuvABC endonuclease subunit